MQRVGRALLGAGAGLAALAAVAPALAAPSAFDGQWSVLVITQSGNCDQAYRYGLRVEQGAIRHAGDASFDITGQVRPNGTVRVSISRGSQNANATGRLSARSGSGTWSGGSPGSQCRGRWEAERR